MKIIIEIEENKMEKIATNRKLDTKTMVVLSIISTLAYLAVVIFRIPVVEFLKYEPKDAIITIAAFIYGPLPAFLVAIVVSFLEMVTISTTGFIGLIMNILSSAGFACVAGIVYKKRKSKKNAIIGLILGVVVMTVIMLLWNYLLTPIYMGVSREVVVSMLLPVFLPFNLIKGALNSVITMLLYKSVVGVLRKSKLLPREEVHKKDTIKSRVALYVICTIIFATAVLLILVYQGVL